MRTSDDRSLAPLTWFHRLSAIAVVALTQRDVWAQPAIDGTDRTALAVVLFGATLTLVWRHRAPMLCAFVVGVSLMLQAAITDIDLDSLGWTLALVVALYSVAAFADLRHALIGFGALVAGLATRELRQSADHPKDPADAAFWWLLTATWFGVGLYMRSRRRAHELHDMAMHIQADADAKARQAVTEERARIAQELHDVVAQDVSAVVLQAEAAEALLDVAPERVRERLQTIQRLSREAVAEMRQMLGVLRPDGDDQERTPQPTLAALPALVARHRNLGAQVDLIVEGDARPLPPGLEVSAYRVVQESLSNVCKHAPGAPATVVVGYRANALEIEVVNGLTSDAPAPADAMLGHGVAGMRARVRFFGGTFTAGPRLDGGHGVHAVFPTP